MTLGRFDVQQIRRCQEASWGHRGPWPWSSRDYNHGADDIPTTVLCNWWFFIVWTPIMIDQARHTQQGPSSSCKFHFSTPVLAGTNNFSKSDTPNRTNNFWTVKLSFLDGSTCWYFFSCVSQKLPQQIGPPPTEQRIFDHQIFISRRQYLMVLSHQHQSATSRTNRRSTNR